VTDAAPLIEYLKQLQAKGQTHVGLDSIARDILRKFYIRAKKGNQPVVSESIQESTSVVIESPIMPEAVTEVNITTEVKPIETAKAVIPQKFTGGSLADKYAFLQESYKAYAPLLQLGTLRPKIVFPQVSSAADIMFVSESPNYHDEKNGIPVSGPRGQKLDGVLKAMGLARDGVHITYILKNRPAMQNQTTNNRKASLEELATAKPLMDQEISLFQPKIIIALGEDAAKFFTQSTDDLDQLRGQVYKYTGIPVIPTFSPSFLLHNTDTRDKRSLWEDMLKVMEMLEMPISDRQRGFFAPS